MMMTIFTFNNNNNDDNDENHHRYDFTQQENSEQCAVINRIRSENRVPITGPTGTGKSTVISQKTISGFGLH
jgi:hypothetical protein